MSLLENSEVNAGRQPFLDVDKSFSHPVQGICSRPALFRDSGVVGRGVDGLGAGFYGPFLDNVLGGTLFAPVFMFAMGVGAAYSRSPDPANQARRCRRLFVQGVLLNLVRSAPFALAMLLMAQPKALHDAAYANLWFNLYVINILPFAGLSFCLYAKARLGVLPKGDCHLEGAI